MPMPEETSEGARRRRDQDEIVMAALAACADYATAAEAAGVSVRTVRRRMADPSFAAEVSRRRGERVSALTGRLLDSSELAVGVIERCMGSDSPAIQLRAADLALHWGTRLRASNELERRIDALEHGGDRPSLEPDDLPADNADEERSNGS